MRKKEGAGVVGSPAIASMGLGLRGEDGGLTSSPRSQTGGRWGGCRTPHRGPGSALVLGCKGNRGGFAPAGRGLGVGEVHTRFS